MTKFFLMKNPELFQGEKYLDKTKNYFEGWYFKNTNKDYGISFIPGISINEKEKKAFIQVIANDSSYYVNYDIEDFTFNHDPFYIQIADNFFSKENVHINIKDINQNLYINGNIEYSDSQNIKTTLFNPNIMGPFSYIPFMECNHAILCMKSKVNGFITINDKKLEFGDGNGYIEKDWGYSFPKKYIWCQGNNFKNKNASFMISVADIPFKLFHFTGFICTLLIDNKEYRFSTYNNAKIIKYDVSDNLLDIEIKKGTYTLKIKSKYTDGLKLIAPVKGKMEKDIIESISENIKIILKRKNKIIFYDTSYNCGVEIVQ